MKLNLQKQINEYLSQRARLRKSVHPGEVKKFKK